MLRRRLWAAYATAASKILPLCIARKFVSGSPSGQPPSAKITERARATARVCHGCRGSFARKLFREARRARPQRQNNGARACDGAGLPWLSASKIPPLSGSPSSHPPAPKRRRRARGRLSLKLWPSPGKLFREARRASPQRQNNGACACDGAGLPWLSQKPRPSPGKLFREARRASFQRQNYGSERKRRAVAQKVFLGSPTGPTPASKRRERAFGAARRARPKTKPSTILHIAKNGTRRARAGFLRTLNPKRF